MVLQVEAIMELLKVCLGTTCFQGDDESLQVKTGMAVENSLLLIISNLYVKFLKNLFSTQHKLLWLNYIDDTFVT
jgi:hypothetical protein